MKKWLVLGFLLVAVLVCWWENMAPEVTDVPTVTEKLPEKQYVYVTGAVKQPGLYAFDQPVTAGEAVKAAGDVLPYADVGAVNLAERAPSGTHIHLPYDLNGVPAVAEVGKVSINTADEKALTDLNGIGPAMAASIIAYRQEHGSFASVEELQKVKGIGPAKFAKIKDQVSL